MLKKKTIVLSDADGEQHHYLIRQLPGEAGMKLWFEIVRAVGQPIGDLIAAATGQPSPREGPDIEAEESDGDETSIMDSQVDGQKLGSALTGLAENILQAGGVKFVKRLLHGTIRDKKVFSDGPLGGDKLWCINDMGANYGELFTALGHVLALNYSNLFSGLLKSLPSAAWAEGIAEKLQQLAVAGT